jgi:hypothetical protein
MKGHSRKETFGIVRISNKKTNSNYDTTKLSAMSAFTLKLFCFYSNLTITIFKTSILKDQNGKIYDK